MTGHLRVPAERWSSAAPAGAANYVSFRASGFYYSNWLRKSWPLFIETENLCH